MTARDDWADAERNATTNEEKWCVGAAEDNAHAAANDDGFEPFSERWYEMCLSSYEFLMDNAVYPYTNDDSRCVADPDAYR